MRSFFSFWVHHVLKINLIKAKLYISNFQTFIIHNSVLSPDWDHTTPDLWLEDTSTELRVDPGYIPLMNKKAVGNDVSRSVSYI